MNWWEDEQGKVALAASTAAMVARNAAAAAALERHDEIVGEMQLEIERLRRIVAHRDSIIGSLEHRLQESSGTITGMRVEIQSIRTDLAAVRSVFGL